MQCPLASAADEVPSLALDQLGRRLRIAPGEVVSDRITGKAAGLQPGRRSAVTLLDAVDGLQSQPLGEQRVVAVPLTSMVEREQEEVEPVQLDELLLGAAFRPVTASHSERVQPVEDRGLEQEGAHVVRDAREHLVAQVVGDVPIVAGEVVDERTTIGVVLQRNGRQLHPDRPPFGAIDQRAHIVGLPLSRPRRSLSR